MGNGLSRAWIEPRRAAQSAGWFSGITSPVRKVVGPMDIHCINDSKATNVGATMAALAGFALDSG